MIAKRRCTHLKTLPGNFPQVNVWSTDQENVPTSKIVKRTSSETSEHPTSVVMLVQADCSLPKGASAHLSECLSLDDSTSIITIIDWWHRPWSWSRHQTIMMTKEDRKTYLTAMTSLQNILELKHRKSRFTKKKANIHQTYRILYFWGMFVLFRGLLRFPIL